jgi:hypothetical protein
VSFVRRLFQPSNPQSGVERPHPVQSEPEVPGSIPGVRAHVTDDGAVVTVDLDEFGSKSRPALLDRLTQASGLPVFAGSIEHGYAMRSVGSHFRCPRCNAATRQQMAHFIYATDIAPRAMFAPAGYFCTTCPTVIVDESLIATSMKEGYRFRAVVGVDYAGEKQPDFFKTWNGQESIYLLDEDGRVMDLTTDNQLQVDSPAVGAGARQDSAARKRRRKMAQQSRKRNRR